MVIASTFIAVLFIFPCQTSCQQCVYTGICFSCRIFELAFISLISQTSYYNLQKDYFFGVANEAWVNEQKGVVSKISQRHLCVFSCDGRCDSPGHNAKYLTFTFLEHSINKIVAMPVTQFTKCGNSNRMEKYGFQKLLHGMARRQRYYNRQACLKNVSGKSAPISIISLRLGMFAKTFVKSCQKLLKRSQQAF